jgi:hypothetical protein
MENSLDISGDRKIRPPPQSSSGRANDGEAPMLGAETGACAYQRDRFALGGRAALVNILCHKEPVMRVTVDNPLPTSNRIRDKDNLIEVDLPAPEHITAHTIPALIPPIYIIAPIADR